MAFMPQFTAFTIFLAIAALGFLFLIVALVFGEIFDFFDHDLDLGMDHGGPGVLSSRVIAVFITAFGGFGANRQSFAQKLTSEATVDLEKMGIGVDVLTIQEISDEEDYLNALGKRRTAEVKRDASIGEAEAHRDAKIKSSLALQEPGSAELGAPEHGIPIAVTTGHGGEGRLGHIPQRGWRGADARRCAVARVICSPSQVTRRKAGGV